MKLRAKNNTTIEYILVANGSPIISPILPPEAFKNNVIDFLKNCPIDILQLIDSFNYLEAYWKNLWSYGVDFHIFNIGDYKKISNEIDKTKQIQVLFLDASKKEHIDLFQILKSNKSIIRFYNFYNSGDDSIEFKDDFIVNSPRDLISKMSSKQHEIFQYLGLTGVEICPSVALEYKDFNEFYYFIPTRNNFFLLNNIIGNFCFGSHKTEAEIIEKHTQESMLAHKATHSFDRQNLFVKQINKIDYFRHISYEKGILKPVSGIEPYLAPLIIVLPFHNPDLKEIYGNVDIIRLLQIEQTENYVHTTDNKESPELVVAALDIQKERINYLDNVSFLHSSLTFSPIVRLPLKGKSIYRELSYFRTKSFPNLSIPKNRKKLKKTISSFGSILSEKVLSSKLSKVINKRNGQIVAISDLPLEWLLVDGIPLSFTHDVCRLPETSLHGLMSFYTNNQMIEFSISSEILKKTLVIFGGHEESFKVWHEEVYKLQKSINFTIAECNSLNDVYEAVHSFKPDLLIFDCHGGFDENTRSTYLVIGDEKLDGGYIVKNQIYAPIVFLSACGTAPTYGTMNPIANAFFEAGAISVTSTFLPISVDYGSVLYFRILYKLDYAIKHKIHKNWLEFISHLIRTSTINDAYRYALDKEPQINNSDFFNSNVTALNDSLVFSKRRRLFNDLNRRLSSMSQKNRDYYSEVVPEYLLYTNLGRSDLILFDIWEEEYKEKNVC